MDYQPTVAGAGTAVESSRPRRQFPSLWLPLSLGLLLLAYGLLAVAGAPGDSARDLQSQFVAGWRVTAGTLRSGLGVSLALGLPLGLVLGNRLRRARSVILDGLLSLWLYPMGAAAPYLCAYLFALARGPSLQALVLGLGLGGVPLVSLGVARALAVTRSGCPGGPDGSPDGSPRSHLSGFSGQGAPAGLAYGIGVTLLLLSHFLAAELTLGLLGLAVPPPTPSWGGLLADPLSLVRVPELGRRMAAVAVGLALLGTALRRWAARWAVRAPGVG